MVSPQQEESHTTFHTLSRRGCLNRGGSLLLLLFSEDIRLPGNRRCKDKMQIICAWCEEFLREEEPIYDKSISHGICQKCYKKIKQEIKKLTSEQVQQGLKKRTRC